MANPLFLLIKIIYKLRLWGKGYVSSFTVLYKELTPRRALSLRVAGGVLLRQIVELKSIISRYLYIPKKYT